MTREEKLQQAADNFSEDHKYEESLDFLSMWMAFEAGAEWADRNPDLSSLWHDASEDPEHNCTIAYATKNNKIGTLKRADKSKWSWYKEKYSILMWAYINDLLPKGGEK